MNSQFVKSLGVFALALGATVPIAESKEMIKDISGYTYLKSSDWDSGESFNQAGNWSDGQVPNANTDYIIQRDLVLRTPEVGECFDGDALPFWGRSLTLDGGKIKSKHASHVIRFDDLIMYNGRIEQSSGGTSMHYDGKITIHGTPEYPSRFSGSSSRNLFIDSELAGGSTSLIRVMLTEEDRGSQTAGRWGIVYFRGKNDGYQGRFLVTDTWMALGVTNLTCLGRGDSDDQTSVVTLSNGGALLLSDKASLENPGYSITVDQAGDLVSHCNTPPSVGNGFRIRGTGKLTIRNSGTIVMNDVNLSPEIELAVRGTFPDASWLRLSEQYQKPDTKISVNFGGNLAGNSKNIGPTMWGNGGCLSPGDANAVIETMGFKSIRAEDGAKLRNSISWSESGGFTSDFIRVYGKLSKAAPDAKIKIEFDDPDQCLNPRDGLSIRLLTASNLGGTEADAFTAGDFEVYDKTGHVPEVLKGQFSIVEENGTNYLVWERSPYIALTADDDAESSFSEGGHWSDGLPPSADKDYVIPGGRLLRCRRGGTFQGRSLTVFSGGDMAVNGVQAVTPDLRMEGGAMVSARNAGDYNQLDGNLYTYQNPITRYASFVIEESRVSPDDPYIYRALKLPITLHGDGAVCYRGYPVATWNSRPEGTYFVTGENTDFVGRVQIFQPGVIVEFKDETSIGGNPAAFVADQLNFRSNAVLRCASSYAIDDSNRGIYLGEGGGTFRVLEDQALTISVPISGESLNKDGAGDLVITSANTCTGATQIAEGRLVARNANALGTGPIACSENGVLRIESAEPLSIGGTEPFIEGTSAVQPISFDGLDSGVCGWTSLFILPQAESFDPSRIRFVNGKFHPQSRNVEFRALSREAGGIEVRVKVTRVGLLILLK